MKKSFISGLAFLVFCIHVFSQMPDAISIFPENATSADLITLTFNPEFSCYESGTLIGAEQIYMHSGIINNPGSTWQKLVPYDDVGANGQAPILQPNGDGTYSMTFVPDLFYNDYNLSHICAVFNSGDWSNDARDSDHFGECTDFIIPLCGNIYDTVINFNVNLNYQIQNGIFDPDTDTVFLMIDGIAVFEMFPQGFYYSGIYNREVYGLTTGLYNYQFAINNNPETMPIRQIFLHSGINKKYHWYNNEAAIPEGINIDPPDATAWDNITLTFDPELVCYESASLLEAPWVEMHSGVVDMIGASWSFVIGWNEVGINGQDPKLLPDGSGKYYINFTPGEYYGLPPGNQINTLCAVFTYEDWMYDGRDFTADGLACMDFFIPINYVTSQTIHVPADFLTIQEAIDAASHGDIVLVDEGTYYENINFIGKAITVASHFLMDGDTNHINNTVINGSQPLHPDSASVVYFISGEDTSSIIKGFTIQGGNGTPSSWGNGISGGGIFCEGSGPIIEFNKIINNHCVGSGTYISGGGIFSDTCFNRTTLIQNNFISENYCSNINSTTNVVSGGGICVLNNAIIHANTISNNSIYNGYNKQALGGGIEASMAKFIITENIITGNTVENTGTGWNPHGGGIYGQDQLEGTIISSNWIEDNSVKGSNTFGGGIALWSNEANIFVDKNIIKRNDARRGAGISIGLVNEVEISNNVIWDNSPLGNNNNSGARGGGLYFYLASSNSKVNTGIRSKNCDNPHITTSKNLIPVISNNTIIGNSSHNGGGITAIYAINPILVFNNILYDNTSVNPGNDIYLLTNTDMYLFNNNVNPDEITGTGSWEGEDNIFENPEFDEDGYHLLPESPCINVGAYQIIIGEQSYNCPDHDIDGEVRPYETTHPDMGADETPYFTTSIDEYADESNLDIYFYNDPNPFSITTTISFSLQEYCCTELSLYDLTGKRIQTILNREFHAGKHKIELDTQDLQNGLYFCVLKSGTKIQITKMIKY